MRKSSGVVDIARACGVSPSTVCRALNNKTDISEKTREKILESCRKLGYSKNLVASNLRLKKSSVVSVIMPGMTNELFMEKLFFLKQEVINAGFIWQLSSYSDNDDALKIFYETLSMRPAGIVTGFKIGHDEVNFLNKNTIAAVAYDTSIKGVDSVALDREKGIFEAVSYLFECGCQHPLLIGSDAESERGKGFLKAVKKYGIENYFIDDTPYARNLFEYGYRRVTELLQKKVEFDSVQAVNDAAAIGAIRAMNEHGLNVPGDVRVIGFDNIMSVPYISPSLTTIAQPIEKMAEFCVKYLVQRINSPNSKRKSRILNTHLIKRESA